VPSSFTMFLLLLLLRAFIERRITQGPQVRYADSGRIYCLVYTLSKQLNRNVLCSGGLNRDISWSQHCR